MNRRRMGIAASIAIAFSIGISVGHPGVRGATREGAIKIDMQMVYKGCNDIVVQASAATPWTTVVDHFSDPVSVYAVWRFENQLQRYVGVYFSDPQAPVDGPPMTGTPAFAIFACVGHDGIVT